MTIVIEGDLTLAQGNPDGRMLIARVRRALATGGRGMLAGAGGTKRYEVGIDLFTVTIYLAPLIARRIYTSGASLTDAEIRAGLDQLRESDEDVERRMHDETRKAMLDGEMYGIAQYAQAIQTGDEHALHRAWEMARKVNGLRKRLDTMDEGTG